LLRWQVLAGAVLITTVVLVWKQTAIDSQLAALWSLRGVMLVLVMSSLFLLDDASANLVESVVFPHWIRTGLRVLAIVVLVSAGGVLSALLVREGVVTSKVGAGLALETACLVLLGVAIALSLQRRRGIVEPGQFAALGVLLSALAAHLLGARWPMLVNPGPDWSAAHLRWLAVLAVALAVVAMCLRDPAAQSLRSKVTGSRG